MTRLIDENGIPLRLGMPPRSRYGDHNARNRELLEETKR
jgi:hypothetical protein